MTAQEQIRYLLSNPELLRMRKPYTRGVKNLAGSRSIAKDVPLNGMVAATLPKINEYVVSEDELVRELDPASHKVNFDENIPSITMKTNQGGYIELENKRMPVPYQRLIRDKRVLHLCGNRMQFTLLNTEPTEKEMRDYIQFKQYWTKRNMDGMRTKMVSAQLSYGSAGLLFYHNYKGEIKARLFSYKDRAILCPHNDDNGDRILESICYRKDDVEFIDSYDDEYMYRHVLDWNASGKWNMVSQEKHGFSEIPLITKRGRVAWDNVQDIIEVYEIIYNVFLVIQKRHGWGILYVKGKFKDLGQQIAGAVVLNDTSMEGNGSADFKEPPSPQNMIDTLGLMEETIQKGSGTTFLLPKDVKSTGDISAQAIMLTQSLDIETALQGVIDWQNVADKMCRLFKEGLAKELVNKGINPTAVTDYQNLDINAQFKVWRPQNDSEYNSMLIQLKGSGLISEETGIEKNTESSPDEKLRRQREKTEALQQAMTTAQQQNINNNNNED